MWMPETTTGKKKNNSSLAPFHFWNHIWIQYVLIYFTPFNHLKKKRWTALFWAAANGDDWMCIVLYNLGADIDATGNDSIQILSPLVLARQQGHDNVVELIMSWHLHDL